GQVDVPQDQAVNDWALLHALDPVAGGSAVLSVPPSGGYRPTPECTSADRNARLARAREPGPPGGRLGSRADQLLCRSAHVRVAVIGRRHEQLLDRPGVDPADQIKDRARLVVGAAGPGAAERLLADDGAGGLVVDVEVAGGTN